MVCVCGYSNFKETRLEKVQGCEISKSTTICTNSFRSDTNEHNLHHSLFEMKIMEKKRRGNDGHTLFRPAEVHFDYRTARPVWAELCSLEESMEELLSLASLWMVDKVRFGSTMRSFVVANP